MAIPTPLPTRNRLRVGAQLTVQRVRHQVESGGDVAAGEYGTGRDAGAADGTDAAYLACARLDPGHRVAEVYAPAVGLQPAPQCCRQGAAAAHRPAGRQPVQHGIPADQIRGRDLVAGRAGLRTEPRQRRAQPFVAEGGVEQGVAGGHELPGDLHAGQPVRPADAPQAAAEVAQRRGCLEGGEDPLVADGPVQHELPVGGGVMAAADRRDRLAGAFQVGPEDDSAAGGVRDRVETPRVAVEVGEPGVAELEFFDDAGVPDQHVQAGPAVHQVAGEALDAGYRAAQHRVPLDDFDVEPFPGEVAGGDERVVPAADDHDVCHCCRRQGRVRAWALPRPSRPFGCRRRLTRIAYSVGLPGKRNRSCTGWNCSLS